MQAEISNLWHVFLPFPAMHLPWRNVCIQRILGVRREAMDGHPSICGVFSERKENIKRLFLDDPHVPIK